MEFQSINILRKEGTVMRKNFGAKPYTYPQPVFILASYGEDGTPDAMNAAWGGISGGSEVTLGIRPDGEVDVAKVEPISFDPFNNKYVKVTEIVGNAFSDGKELM